MKDTWNLEKLYQSFEDPNFIKDFNRFQEVIKEYNDFSPKFLTYDSKEQTLIDFIKLTIEFSLLTDKLYHFASLIESTDATNQTAIKYITTFQMSFSELAKTETQYKKWLRDFPNIDETIDADPLLKEHRFHLHEIIQNAKYMLDEKTEILISKLRQSGSSSWGRLQSLLTSTLAVTYEGKEITLSEVRNLAYHHDAETRKKAYEAELAAYKSIDKSLAFALNGIKGEVNTISEFRGYLSPLDQALVQSRMQSSTLEAMLQVMTDYLPIFRQYLKRKAELLGHKNGLPFYDLFAPVGNITTTYSIEEANQYILKNFKTFNSRLYNMADKAFREGWIDYTPKKGKVGGAFCANIVSIKESRVLTNFTGAFGDIITLAHELGHAYHGEAIFKESPLNSDYTMPVAETASTFCETIVNKAALKDAKDEEEKIYLLESSIQDYTQVIVDIMSRFIFERSVFEGRKKTVFDENELKTLMLDAQKQTYGDGLDENYLHPYMWACKGHYYSGGLSYYNFPYAFGLLFAKGLYAKYLQDKQAFVNIYDDLLAATGQMTVENVAKLANIDVSKPEFWKGSLEIVKEDIDLFLKLTEK
ncbi:MAG: oligoendopeptidase F [Tenericutes bacterium HGW-Tenericutes-1]|jgi:pepF/M3 family oligoendopeptidase|nr:MAG: oligoendopeptidase F [Tenericutes bacterium HGW-Tenericutes-1]